MYDVILIRTLCAEICRTQNEDKLNDLASLLQAVIKDDLEETRTRMAFVRKKYSTIFNESKAAD